MKSAIHRTKKDILMEGCAIDCGGQEDCPLRRFMAKLGTPCRAQFCNLTTRGDFTPVYGTPRKEVILTEEQNSELSPLKRGCPVDCNGEAHSCCMKEVQKKVGFKCTPRGVYDKDWEFFKRDKADLRVKEEKQDLFGKMRVPDMKAWGIPSVVKEWKKVTAWAKKFISEGRASVAASEGTYVEDVNSIKSSLNMVTTNLHEQMLRETARNLAAQIPGITDLLAYKRREAASYQGDHRYKKIALCSSPPLGWATRNMVRDLLLAAWKCRAKKFIVVEHKPDDWAITEACDRAMIKANYETSRRKDLEDKDKAWFKYFRACQLYKGPKPEYSWGTLKAYEVIILCGIRTALGMGHEESIGDLFLRSKNGSSDLVTEAMSYLITNKFRSIESEKDDEDNAYAGSVFREEYKNTRGPFSIASPYTDPNSGKFFGPTMLRLDKKGYVTGPTNEQNEVIPVPITWDKWTEIGTKFQFCKKQRVKKVGDEWIPIDLDVVISEKDKRGRIISQEVKSCHLSRDGWNAPLRVSVKEGGQWVDTDLDPFYLGFAEINNGPVGEYLRHAINTEDWIKKPEFRLTRKGKLMATYYLPVPWAFLKREYWPDKMGYRSDAIVFRDPDKDFGSINFRGWCVKVSVYGMHSWLRNQMDEANVSYEGVKKDWYRGKCIFGVMDLHGFKYHEAEIYVDQNGVNEVLKELKLSGQLSQMVEGDPDSEDLLMQTEWEAADMDNNEAQGLPF